MSLDSKRSGEEDQDSPAAGKSRTARLVLVDGATGYVGSHIINGLTSLGYPVRCLVRKTANTADLAVLESTGAEIKACDLQDLQNLQLDQGPKASDEFSGVWAAIHTIGSIAPKRGETLESLHADQTKAFVKACAANGVSKIIMISSLGSNEKGPSEYHRTKWLAEEQVRASGIPYVILRPSLIIGKTFGRRNSKLVDRYLALIKGNSVPLIAGGGNKVQPVFIGDLVSAVVLCLKADSSDVSIFGRTFDIAGPQVVTMREFVEELMKIVAKQSRPFRSVSPLLARIGAFFCERLQEVPLVSADQIKIALSDNVAKNNGLDSPFKIQATNIEHALLTYLGKDNISNGEKAGVSSPLVRQD